MKPRGSLAKYLKDTSIKWAAFHWQIVKELNSSILDDEFYLKDLKRIFVTFGYK